MVRINVFSVKQVREQGVLYGMDSRRVTGPNVIVELLRGVLQLHEEAQEKFGIITLTTKNDIAGLHVLSIGSLNSSIVHPREVFKSAVLNNAASFICFHNHPSGDPKPSAEDVGMTLRLAECGEMMGIECMDHVIIGWDGYYSLKEGGHI